MAHKRGLPTELAGAHGHWLLPTLLPIQGWLSCGRQHRGPSLAQEPVGRALEGAGGEGVMASGFRVRLMG